MKTLYEWIDRIWQRIAEAVFVRFEYDMPMDALGDLPPGKLVFATPHAGMIEWLILSSWCRKQGLGAILVANRRRILFLSKPLYFLQVIFGRRRFSDLFLSKEEGPRLLLVPMKERKKLFTPTPSERLLSEVYSVAPNPGFVFIPVVFIWRKHARGANRRPSEYLFGLRSRPNFFGKVWYLLRKRDDSAVTGLEPFAVEGRPVTPSPDGIEETEAMRVAKFARRRVLVAYNQEVRVVLGPSYQSPHSVKESIMRDESLQRLIGEISSTTGEDKKRVMSRAYRNLTEIVATYRLRFIELMYVGLRWLFTRVFDGLDVTQKDIAEVRELMKTKPVVFVPCHRSHLDYLIIPYILFLNDMVTPHIAAGINLAFWPVGYLLRMGGAFFIRRSFRGDPLYSMCVKKYVEWLLANRYNIKFFIEGTRSRSGKMLPPAYGMLKMTIEAHEKKVCEDIAFVPVSICYDEVPEQSAYKRELEGGVKVKESATALIKSRKIANRNIGKVYVRFSEPIYAKDVAEKKRQEKLDAVLSLQKTAFDICKRINSVTPVTAKSLVAAVILGHRLESNSLGEVLRLCMMLASYVEVSGTDTSVAPGESLRMAVEQTVRSLQKNGMLSVTGDVPRAYFCENQKRILLNYYKNNGIHCLVLPSITLLSVILVLESSENKEYVTIDDVLKKSKALRALLKFEFFFSPTGEFVKEVENCLLFFFGNFQQVVGNRQLRIADLRKNFKKWGDISVYLRLCGELLESYKVALGFLKLNQKGGEPKALAHKMLKFGESVRGKGKISFPESISLQNYTNALMLFENLGLIKKDTKGAKPLYVIESWGDAHENLGKRLSRYLSVMERDPETLFVESETITDIRPQEY